MKPKLGSFREDLEKTCIMAGKCFMLVPRMLRYQQSISRFHFEPDSLKIPEGYDLVVTIEFIKKAAEHSVERTASQIDIPLNDVNSAHYRFVKA